jgi:hypothetical protein
MLLFNHTKLALNFLLVVMECRPVKAPIANFGQFLASLNWKVLSRLQLAFISVNRSLMMPIVILTTTYKGPSRKN